MEFTIKSLVSLVKLAPDAPSAAKAVSDKFKKLSPRAAKSVVQDVQEYIDGELDRTKLSAFLQQAGL